MSDFSNGFWPLYVAIVSLISIVACAWVLWAAGRTKISLLPGQIKDNTTGHVWDEDLRELNNPLPRWWLWLFIITVIFGLGYLVIFPGLGSFAGVSKWSTTSEHKKDIAEIQAQTAPLYAKFAAQPVDSLATNVQALAIGERLFMNNCSQCHGSDGRGSKSYPDLTKANTAWLGERSAAHIVQTVTNGRTGVMPPMGAALGGDAQISEVAHYVMSLSGSPHDERKASNGQKGFATCAACHGANGKGNKALGAPNLADDYWLYGWGEAAITSIIKNGKTSVMPAQSLRLSPEQIHVVSAYALSLSSVSQTAAAGSITAPALPLTKP